MSDGEKRTREFYNPFDKMPEFDRGLEAYNHLVKIEFVKTFLNPFAHDTKEAEAWFKGYEWGSYLHWLNRRQFPNDS